MVGWRIDDGIYSFHEVTLMYGQWFSSRGEVMSSLV